MLLWFESYTPDPVEHSADKDETGMWLTYSNYSANYLVLD